MVAKPPPKITIEKHEGYRTIFQSGVFGGHRPGFFEWVVYTDEMIADEALSTLPPDPNKVYIKRTLQCRIIVTPEQAKSMAEWLNNHIREYEKKFGKIITPKETGGEKKPPPPTMIS